MKRIIAIILVWLTLCATALAELGRGGGMDMLNEGIAYLNGEGENAFSETRCGQEDSLWTWFGHRVQMNKGTVMLEI